MLGSYEQVPPFGFRRKKLFDVVENGIVFQGPLYEWTEITEFQKVGGVGTIRFADGARVGINMNSFRKEGARSQLSLFGDNPAFRALTGFWHRKKHESLQSPRLRNLSSEIESLANELQSASEPGEVTKIENNLMRAHQEHVRLSLKYLDDLDDEYERLRRKDRVRMILMIITIIAFTLVIAWIP